MQLFYYSSSCWHRPRILSSGITPT